MGWNFSKKLVLPPHTAIRLHRVTSKNTESNIKKCRLHLWRTVYLHLNFSRLAFFLFFFFWLSWHKVVPRGRKFEPQIKVEHKFANIQIAFLCKLQSSLNTCIKGPFYGEQTKANMERYTAHPNVRSKSNK